MVDRVTLRDVEPEDLERFYEHQTDVEALAMAAFRPRDRAAFLEHWTRIRNDDAVYSKTILAAGEVAGHVVCFEQSGRRLVGYWLGREFWARGIATRALGQFLEQVPERPLEAFVAKHNLGSIRVLEKCGFRRTGEGTAPDPAGGEAVEEYVYALGAPAGSGAGAGRD